MAKRVTERQLLALKLDALNDSEVREVLDYISIMESMRRATMTDGLWEDDLVRSLADAHENQRAPGSRVGIRQAACRTPRRSKLDTPLTE